MESTSKYISSVTSSFTKSLKILLFLLVLCLLLLLFRESLDTTILYYKFKNLISKEAHLTSTDKVYTEAETSPEKLLEESTFRLKNVWYDDKGFEVSNGSCIQFPLLQELEFDATNWQVFRPQRHDEMFYLLNAYYDNRPTIPKPVVRIIGYVNAVQPNSDVWCRLWFKNDDGTLRLVTQKTQRFDMLWSNKWYQIREKEFVGHLITCPIPVAEESVPFAVSLAENECDKAKNNLLVRYQQPENGQKKDFMICVKHLDFPFDDMSVRLVEFFEVKFMFGVDKIAVYSHQVHPNMKRVLNYYEELGKIEHVPESAPGGTPNDPYMRHVYLKRNRITNIILEDVDFNDCFYRHMHQYKFIILVNTDEIFVPKKSTNYAEMLRQVKRVDRRRADTYFAPNKMFLKHNDDHSVAAKVPDYMTFLQVHTVATNYERGNRAIVKSFFNTSSVFIVGNHGPFHCLKQCVKVRIPDDIGQYQHYREQCFFDQHDPQKCNNDFIMKDDYTLWKFKEQYIEAVTSVVEKLKLL